jgi:hypothetical protein
MKQPLAMNPNTFSRLLVLAAVVLAITTGASAVAQAEIRKGRVKFAPGFEDEAIFVGSTSGNEFVAPLTAGGNYKVRVYLMRNAARRNESASYEFTFTITNGPAGTPPASD